MSSLENVVNMFLQGRNDVIGYFIAMQIVRDILWIRIVVAIYKAGW